jgi:iron complex outermembrane recepter protein
MNFSHEITLNGQIGPNGLPLNQDVVSSTRAGVELLNNLKLNDHFDVEIAASISSNNINDKEEDFQPILTPENLINFTLSYHQAGFSLDTFIRYQSKAYLNLSNTVSIDPYATLGMRASYTLNNREFRLQVYNVMDKQYLNSGLIDVNGRPKYFVGAPLNTSASVRVNF